MSATFTHLHLHTPYSFLDGAADIETMVRRAAELGMDALAVTDHDNVAAAVKFSTLCTAYQVLPIMGAEFTMQDETHLTLLAANRAGYAALCTLLTLAYAVGGRLTPRLPWSALGIKPNGVESGPAADLSGIICLSGCRKGIVAASILQRRFAQAREWAQRLLHCFGAAHFFVEMQEDLTPHAHQLCISLADLADTLNVGCIATNNVHYATPNEFAAHDILRCIATKTTRNEIHPGRPLNAERYLKSATAMQELFRYRPCALENSRRIAELCEPALPSNEEITPRYAVPGVHADAAAYLRYLTYKGADARYKPLTAGIRTRIEHELSIITQLGYADYFLMCWEIVRWARKNGIRATGRGSAADSCVAYCLTLTDVDVIRRNLPFARFLVPGKTPDIDMDFPSERRDDVFRYIISRYGEEHTGMVCTFATFWAKSAARDIGKALLIPPEALRWLSDHLSHFIRADEVDDAFGKYAELKPYAGIKDRFKLLFECCGKIAGFPRHIGTHSSGIVIGRVPLRTIAPLQPSARGITQIWELDKDDAETLGAIKFDVLSLRMLSAVGDAERDLQKQDAARNDGTQFSYNSIPFNDAATFKMMRAGKAVGTFQFESSAQMALATNLHPQHFEDLVASVALIRPGPVRGNVVGRFVACRNGYMRADVLHPALEVTLRKTYGCIVFQEQVNDVVAAMTGCTDAEADKFRKSITRHHRFGTMDELRGDFVTRSCAHHRDFNPQRANALFNQIEGWAGYGFTEGHAASFALTGYRTAYLSVHHAAAFFAGQLNHQPMGYYSANSLVGEARRRGVRILPVDINRSPDRSYAEEESAIRVGLRLVAELREEDIAAIETARAQSPFQSLLDFCIRVPIQHNCIENLVLCGAFDSLHEHRRGILWNLDQTLAMARIYRPEVDSLQPSIPIPPSAVPHHTPVAWELEEFSPWDRFLWTWRLTGVCAESHVFAWLREALNARGIITAYQAQQQRNGAQVRVAGLNIRPHRPPTRSGKPVLFTTVEDETEMLPITVVGDAILQATGTLLTAPAVVAQGTIQRKGQGVGMLVKSVHALRIEDLLPEGGTVPTAFPHADRTYTGTKIHSNVEAVV